MVSGKSGCHATQENTPFPPHSIPVLKISDVFDSYFSFSEYWYFNIKPQRMYVYTYVYTDTYVYMYVYKQVQKLNKKNPNCG